MPLPLALTQVCYVPLHTPASIYNACALKVNDRNVIIASGKQGRLSMVALVDGCPVERQFDTRKERKYRTHHNLHRFRARGSNVPLTGNVGTVDSTARPRLGSPLLKDTPTGLGNVASSGRAVAVDSTESECPIDASATAEKVANGKETSTHRPRAPSNESSEGKLAASTTTPSVVSLVHEAKNVVDTNDATGTTDGRKNTPEIETPFSAINDEAEDSEDDNDDVTAVVSVVAYLEKSSVAPADKDEDSKIVVAVTLVIPGPQQPTPVNGSASSATGGVPQKSMGSNASASTMNTSKSTVSGEGATATKAGGLMYPVGNPQLAQYSSLSSQAQNTPTINLIPTSSNEPSPNTFVLRFFVAPLTGACPERTAETAAEIKAAQAKLCLDWLDNLVEVQEIALNYKPFYMFHTTSVDGRRLLLLCGSDHRVHIYGRPDVSEKDGQDLDDFVELMKPAMFPEFASLRSTALSCEMRYLPQATQRITVVGCRSGYLKLSVLNYATNVIELEEHVYLDGPVTAVELFTDKPNDSEDSPVHLLVTCAVEAAFVYRDVVVYGLEKGTHLPGSSDADTVNCLLVRDVTFRQTNSILLGTFGNKLLRYSLHQDSEAQDYVLSETYDLGQPVFLLLSSDVTKDGVDELIILLRDGILVSKVGLEQAQERCRTVLGNLASAIMRLRDRKGVAGAIA